MPKSLTRSMARSIAALWPEMTTWPGSLSFATVQTSPCAAAAASASAFSMSAPSRAAMAPMPTGTAACIERPRSLSSLAVVAMSKAPTALSAVYSPRLWPATASALSRIETLPSRSSTRSTASALAMIAGWAFSVSVSSASGPSLIMRNRFCPSASSTSPKISRATGEAAASAAPMPTAWLPCPGKMNARMASYPLIVQSPAH